MDPLFEVQGDKTDASGDHFFDPNKIVDAYREETLGELNKSPVLKTNLGDTDTGYVTECQVGGCALKCLSTNKDGVFRLIARNGQAACEQ